MITFRTITQEVLLSRLTDSEDQLVERKEERVSYEEVAKTLVAFANSLHQNQEGILFIGISDKGLIKGVTDTDKKQRWVANIAQETVYPPIPIEHYVLEVESQKILAVVVRRSFDGPHFAGPAYVRIGSESRKASKAQFDLLVAARQSPLRPIIEAFKSGEDVLVDRLAWYNPGGTSRTRGKVVAVNAQYVEFAQTNSGEKFSVSSDRISVGRSIGLLLIVERP